MLLTPGLLAPLHFKARALFSKNVHQGKDNYDEDQ